MEDSDDNEGQDVQPGQERYSEDYRAAHFDRNWKAFLPKHIPGTSY